MANTQGNASAKPTYLGLLNAISLAETRAGRYLEAWAEATDDEDLASTLRLVAARERSHGEVFCRRLAELGYALRPKADPEAQKRLAKVADPAVSDLEKVGPQRPQGADPFADICARIESGEYDPMTASLLTWYIAEERDSAARLDTAFDGVRRKANGAGSATGAPGADAQAIMACMTAGFARLEKPMEKLAKSLR
ncbi:MAG TPA: hypothetical protein VGS12_17160 [Caulobacteraceae bacterium]|nr:hypothetical protein [Caulobacteraceae bacterium]